MTNDQLLKIVEQYSRKSESGYDEITVTRVPDQKTVFVEQIEGEIDDVGRAIMMDKVRVDGTTYWAGYSSRSETVYISLSSQDVATNPVDC